MERALSEWPALRKGVILGQLPRHDAAQLSTLTELYNSTLQQLVTASHHNQRLVMVGHPSLASTTEAKKTAMFGSPTNPRNDGIHLRGSEGARRHTDSVISALKSAGLAGWTTQGRQGAARIQPASSYSRAAQTGNRFQPLLN